MIAPVRPGPSAVGPGVEPNDNTKPQRLYKAPTDYTKPQKAYTKTQNIDQILAKNRKMTKTCLVLKRHV